MKEVEYIHSVKLVCFSPTGTSKTVLQAIAKGINTPNTELFDITLPYARGKMLKTSVKDLLIVAVPVYMGRVPALITDWLKSIQAEGTPAVCVVVYGNRAYENSLLELKDILVSCGAFPFAGAAFIGEHSFSSPELPSSAGRPDKNDLHQAELFGQIIIQKLKSGINNCIDIPGSYPYGEVIDLWKVDFITVSNECTQCNVCLDGCPAGAIALENGHTVDINRCTLCCACIKHCPQNARSIKPGLMKEAAIRCYENFKERKEPELFV